MAPTSLLAASPPLYALLATPAVHIITIFITAVSAYYIWRQEITRYRHVRTLLFAVNIFFIALVFLEFLRNLSVFFPFFSSWAYMWGYTVADTTFMLIDVMLLTLVAISVYLKPTGSSITSLFSEMRKKPPQLILFGAFLAYVVIIDVYLFAYTPFSTRDITNIANVSIAATDFNSFYLSLLLAVLVIFSAYPATLLFAATRKTSEVDVGNALRILPLAWIGIGLDILVFNGYLLAMTPPLDASALGYLLATIAFSVTALIFRRASVLTGFFQLGPIGEGVPPSNPFSERLGVGEPSLSEKNFLLEVDPSSKYEDAVKDFAVEFVTHGYLVFAFTSKGRPVYNTLEEVEGVRFYTLSAKVSYPRSTDQAYEVLVPQNDQSVLLNVLDKALAANPEVKCAVIFDSITDLMLSAGFDNAYKFLKQANEIVNEARATALFLVTKGAHDEKQLSIIKSLFTNHLSFEGGQLKVTRA